MLSFYKEHGRIGDWDGKFDEQIRKNITLLIDEIAAVLATAFMHSAQMPTGVLIATLKNVQKQPSLAISKNLPGAVDRALAGHYQRNKEKPGTFWPDAMYIRPVGFNGVMRRPTGRRLAKAAALATHQLLKRRHKGRPKKHVSELLAYNLRAIFSRSGRRVTLISEYDDLLRRQIERGDFLDFVNQVLPPLQALLTRYRLPPVSANTIARLAISPALSPP